MTIELTSPAFGDGEPIPARYSKDGGNEPPPLKWTGVPAGTAELALAVLDPDAPRGTFVHWVVAGIDPAVPGMGEGPVPGVEGRNGWGEIGYGGPKPPRGDPPHRYIFTLYALAEPSGFVTGGHHVDLLDAMRAKELTEASLVGYYSATVSSS